MDTEGPDDEIITAISADGSDGPELLPLDPEDPEDPDDSLLQLAEHINTPRINLAPHPNIDSVTVVGFSGGPLGCIVSTH